MRQDAIPSSPNYTRLMHDQPGYRWWKPVPCVLLAAIIFVVLDVAFVVAVLLVADMLSSGTAAGYLAALEDSTSYLGIDYADPVSILVAAGSVVPMIPAVGIAMKATGLGGLRTLSSDERRLRLGRTLIYVGWGLLAEVLLALAIPCAIEFAATGTVELGELRVAPAALVTIAVAIPLQCAAEEYAYRGLAMQTFGAWIPASGLAIALQAVVFALSHGYNLYGNISVAVTGLLLGILAWATGGLEASIALHVANNLYAFVLGSLFASQTVQTDVTVVSMAVDIVITVLVFCTIMAVARHRGELKHSLLPRRRG